MTTTRIAIHFPAWPPYIDPKKRSRSYRLPLTIGTLFFWTFFGPPSIRPAAALAAGAGGPGEADSCLWYKLLCVDKTNDYDDILWYACKSMYSIYIVYCILYSIYTCTKIHMLLYIYTHIITYLYLNNIYIYIYVATPWFPILQLRLLLIHWVAKQIKDQNLTHFFDLVDIRFGFQSP